MEALKHQVSIWASWVKRLKKALKALWILARNPWKLNLILDMNEEWEDYVMKKYHLTSLPVIPFQHFMSDSVTVEPYSFLEGGAWPTDLALLKQLASDITACRYFEIGTWRGESVTNVASSAAQCYTLNLPEKELSAMVPDNDFLLSQRFFSKNIKNIKHLFGDSRTFDFESLGMKFDLIFIDGDHHYDTIVQDTRRVLQYLFHEDSVIVWHDYAHNPELIRHETMAAILDACPVSLHPFLYHAGNTNCALLYRKQPATVAFKRFGQPEQYFSVKLKMKPI